MRDGLDGTYAHLALNELKMIIHMYFQIIVRNRLRNHRFSAQFANEGCLANIKCISIFVAVVVVVFPYLYFQIMLAN